MWMLLHGFTGSPASWDTVAAHADLGEDPVRPWLTGHGPRWRDRAAATFEGEVARLVEVAAATDPPRRLAGYSLGARVALGMLVARPDLFDSAVLVGVHPGLDDAAERAERRRVDADRAQVLRERGTSAFVERWEREPLFATQTDVEASALTRQREIRLGHEAEGLARSLEVLGLGAMPSLWSQLGRVRASFTPMVGERDPKFLALAERIAASSARTRVVRVPHAGHNLLLEAPGAVATVLREVGARPTEEGAS